MRYFFLIFHRKVPLRKLYFVTLAETVRASAKMRDTTFIDFNICHRMGAIAKFVLRDLDIQFQDHIFQMLISQKP